VENGTLSQLNMPNGGHLNYMDFGEVIVSENEAYATIEGSVLYKVTFIENKDNCFDDVNRAVQCTGYTAKGVRCKNKTDNHSKLCGFHTNPSLPSDIADETSSHIDNFVHDIKLGNSYMLKAIEALSGITPNNMKAIENYTLVEIYLHDTNPELYFNRGILYMREERYQKAINDFSKAISIKSNDHEALLKRGTCYALLNDYSAAIDDFTTSIYLNPENADAFFYRGLSKMQLGLKTYKDFKTACDMGLESSCEAFISSNCY